MKEELQINFPQVDWFFMKCSLTVEMYKVFTYLHNATWHVCIKRGKWPFRNKINVKLMKMNTELNTEKAHI
jgi:hypothetical protein